MWVIEGKGEKNRTKKLKEEVAQRNQISKEKEKIRGNKMQEKRKIECDQLNRIVLEESQLEWSQNQIQLEFVSQN